MSKLYDFRDLQFQKHLGLSYFCKNTYRQKIDGDGEGVKILRQEKMLWFVRNFNFGIEEKGKYQYKITTDKENLLDLKCSELIFFQSPVSEGLVKAQNFRSHVVNCFHEIILPFTWRPHIYLVMFTVCWELLLVIFLIVELWIFCLQISRSTWEMAQVSNFKFDTDVPNECLL